MGWGHRTTLKESIYWEGGHRTYFVGVGTPHNIYRKSLAVGGWVGGGWSKPENNATLWLHLASWNLPDSQLSWESKMEPSVATCKSDNRKYFPQLPDIDLVLGTNIYISILK